MKHLLQIWKYLKHNIQTYKIYAALQSKNASPGRFIYLFIYFGHCKWSQSKGKNISVETKMLIFSQRSLFILLVLCEAEENLCVYSKQPSSLLQSGNIRLWEIQQSQNLDFNFETHTHIPLQTPLLYSHSEFPGTTVKQALCSFQQKVLHGIGGFPAPSTFLCSNIWCWLSPHVSVWGGWLLSWNK